MNVNECARVEGLIHSFFCLYKCAINCCLFIFYYIFVYFDFCFLHNFCRLTRMFFYNALPAFCSIMGRKYRDKLCVYVFNGYASVSVVCVCVVLEFLGCALEEWVWEEGGSGRIPLRHAHEIDTFHARLLFSAICCCCFCCYSFG